MSRAPTLAAFTLLLALASPALAAEPVHDTIVQQYLSAKWDDLDATLKANAKEIAALTGQAKADVTYIKQSVAESRPAWWGQVKAGKRVGFHPQIWGRTMDLIFDPAIKNSVETKSNGFSAVISVQWAAADMDNPAPAEHGFSRGDLGSLAAFSVIGTAAAWSSIPQSAMTNMTAKDKALLFRALDFRGDLTGVYYGTPRARHWGLWLYLHSYEPKYAKLTTVNARKAVAAALLAEFAANPKAYPSIKLPDPVDADRTEEKLALALQKPLEKKGWTLAEDRSIREMLKALATANPTPMKTGGVITLASGQTVQLDPEADGPLRARRDAWLKQAVEKSR